MTITQNQTKLNHYFNEKGVETLDKLYTCAEIAERYGVKTLTVWDWIRKKKLPAVRIGKEYRIRADDVQAFEKQGETM